MRAAALLLTTASLFAQGPVWQAPANGLIYDAVTQSIRAIVGIPGSAFAGPAVQSGVDWASLAANGRSGLVRVDGHLSYSADFAATNQDPVALDFADVPDRSLWSADSSRAVLLSSSANAVSWIGNFNTGGVVQARWDLTSTGATDWKLLAADTNADAILLTATIGGNSTLWYASSTSAPSSLGALQGLASAAFAAQSAAAYVADAGAHIVYLVQPQANPGMQPVLTADDGIGDPAGLLITGNDQQIVVSDTSTQKIYLYDLNSRAALQALDLYDSPTAIVPVAPTRFLVNDRERADQPFRLLDTSGPLKVLFLPAGDLQ